MAYAVNHNAPMGGLSSLMAMKGRMGDTELVHMSKPEVDALGAMGKLHVNPETGLPEAFGLREILPAAAGIGMAIFAPQLLPGVFGAGGTFGAFGSAAAAGIGTAAGGLAVGQAPGQALMNGVVSGGLSALGTQFLGGAEKALEPTDAIGQELSESVFKSTGDLNNPILENVYQNGQAGVASQNEAMMGQNLLTGGGENLTVPQIMGEGALADSMPYNLREFNPSAKEFTYGNMPQYSQGAEGTVKIGGNYVSNVAPPQIENLTAPADLAPSGLEGLTEPGGPLGSVGSNVTPSNLESLTEPGGPLGSVGSNVSPGKGAVFSDSDFKGPSFFDRNTPDWLRAGIASKTAHNPLTYALPLAGAYLSQTPEAPEQQAGIKRPAPPSYYGSKVVKGGQRTGSPTSSQNALDIALGRAPNKQQFTPITYEDNPDYEGQQQASIQGGGLTGMMATGGAIRKMAQDLQKKGNGDDVLLAHINPKEAKMLKRAGGSGTVNPKTGLLQFEDGDSSAGDWAGSAGADGEGGGGASSSGASSSDGGASSAGDWAGSAGADGMGGGGASMGGGASAGGSDTGNDGGASMDGMGNFGMGAPGGNTGFGPGSGLSGLDQSGLGPSGPSKQGNLGRSADDIDLEEADQNSKNAPPAAPWQDPDTPVSNYFQNLVANPLATAVNTGLALGAMALNGTPFGAAASLASLGNTVSGVFGGPTAGSAMFGGPSTGPSGPATAGQGQQQGNPNGPGTATADVGQSQSMSMAQAPSAPATGPQMGPGGDSGGVQPYYPPRVAQGSGLVSLATGGQAKAPQGKQYFEGQVSGNGDGMSDEVPFDIHNSNPNKALLSKDEYVLPADVVSMIGNGSSNAGSEEIDRFVAHIRKKAHGVSKQQKQLKGDKGLRSLMA